MLKPYPSRYLLVFLLALLAPLASNAAIQTFVGTARRNGKIVYLEKHIVHFDRSGKVLDSETNYELPDGKIHSTLTTNYQVSLTAPSHVNLDHLTNSRYGIRYEKDQLVLFSQDQNQAEKTKVIPGDNSDRLMIGCQGLNYFIKQNLELATSKNKRAIRLLVPGSLDSYDFELGYAGNKNGELEFELVPKSFFLKIFGPSFSIRYRDDKISYYKGLSNISFDGSGPKVVEISYEYQALKEE